MKYEISISKSETYVKVKVNETISAEMARDFAEEAIKKANQHNIKKFLIDVRGTRNVAGHLENYLFAYENVNRFGLDRNSRIGVIVSPGDKSHDFVETVLMNAGYNCCLFLEEYSAIEWLEE